MKHREVVERILAKCRKESHGHSIDPKTSRDQFLYGHPEDECTGIVVTCYASVQVLKEAVRIGANLVIAHESMFYFHGDATDWLSENESFLAKVRICTRALSIRIIIAFIAHCSPIFHLVR